MTKTIGFVCAYLFLSTFSYALEQSPEIFIQEASEDKVDESAYRPLDIGTVIEQGMRSYQDNIIRRKNIEILKNRLKDTKEEFWTPNPKINFQLNPQRIGTLKSGSNDLSRTSRSASGSVGLELGEYTLFNWGKDYLNYKNEKESLERQIDRDKETLREFKQELVREYVKLIHAKDLKIIARQYLQRATLVYRMNREKVLQKKVTKHEYYQSRAEYLRAQEAYTNAKTNENIASEDMAKRLNDPPGTLYFIKDDYQYEKSTYSRDNAIATARKVSPFILDKKVERNIKNREYEIAVRDNLPLPKITVNFGTYSQIFDGSSVTNDYYTTSPGNSNIDLVASLNASWTLFGDGGLFNRRKLANARLEKEKAMYDLSLTRRKVEEAIVNIFNFLNSSVEQLNIIKSRNDSLKKRMETALYQYTNRKTRYLEYQLAMQDYFDSLTRESIIKFQYLAKRVELAQIVGIENLPDQAFDKAIIKGGGR